MNTITDTRLSDLRNHRAIAAGEWLGGAILALSRLVSRAAQALRAPAVGAPAHTPR